MSLGFLPIISPIFSMRQPFQHRTSLVESLEEILEYLRSNPNRGIWQCESLLDEPGRIPVRPERDRERWGDDRLHQCRISQTHGQRAIQRDSQRNSRRSADCFAYCIVRILGFNARRDYDSREPVHGNRRIRHLTCGRERYYRVRHTRQRDGPTSSAIRTGWPD